LKRSRQGKNEHKHAPCLRWGHATRKKGKKEEIRCVGGGSELKVWGRRTGAWGKIPCVGVKERQWEIGRGYLRGIRDRLCKKDRKRMFRTYEGRKKGVCVQSSRPVSIIFLGTPRGPNWTSKERRTRIHLGQAGRWEENRRPQKATGGWGRKGKGRLIPGVLP